jgi:PAS domain S-box-containing protein
MSLPPLDPAAWLQAIVASSTDAIISKNLNGRIYSWNPAAERMFGWTADEAVGQSIEIIIPPGRASEEDYVLLRVSQGLGVQDFETMRRRKDGSLIDISLTVSPILGADGTIVGASKIARDISRRRQLEREAVRLAAIVASSDDAIVSKNLDGVIQTWNSGAERIFGFTAEEAIGRHISLIIPADRLAEEANVLAHIRAGKAVEHFETVRKRKDGSFVDISLSVSPIYLGNEIIGASKIARDISEQRRLRAEADNASRLKDEFLATLSHELRTPLNTVIGYATMLQKGMIQEPLRSKAIEVIHRNAHVLNRLVGELLDTSRIVTGQIRLQVREADLSTLAVESVENIRPSVDVKRLKLETHIEPGVVIAGDPDRLRQVMWNLLTNAVKFTPPGGRIDVTVSTEPNGARIVVRDSGIGISAEAAPNVFKRFWQGEAGKAGEFSGLGLGLALSRYFVELHGGSIQMKSAGLGKGTEFQVVLPLRVAPAIAEAG